MTEFEKERLEEFIEEDRLTVLQERDEDKSVTHFKPI